MNRDIKFRGFNKKNGVWLYGFYLQNRGAHFVCPDEFANGKTWDDYEVDPDSVGQYTGLTDCNGKEIYEGDILVYGGQCKHVVAFKHGMFGYTLMDGWFVGYGGNSNFSFNPLDKSKEHEVIGNTHDNPGITLEIKL